MQMIVTLTHSDGQRTEIHGVQYLSYVNERLYVHYSDKDILKPDVVAEFDLLGDYKHPECSLTSFTVL